jgi:hypothetical protein
MFSSRFVFTLVILFSVCSTAAGYYSEWECRPLESGCTSPHEVPSNCSGTPACCSWSIITDWRTKQRTCKHGGITTQSSSTSTSNQDADNGVTSAAIEDQQVDNTGDASDQIQDIENSSNSSTSDQTGTSIVGEEGQQVDKTGDTAAATQDIDRVVTTSAVIQDFASASIENTKKLRPITNRLSTSSMGSGRNGNNRRRAAATSHLRGKSDSTEQI